MAPASGKDDVIESSLTVLMSYFFNGHCSFTSCLRHYDFVVKWFVLLSEAPENSMQRWGTWRRQNTFRLFFILLFYFFFEKIVFKSMCNHHERPTADKCKIVVPFQTQLWDNLMRECVVIDAMMSRCLGCRSKLGLLTLSELVIYHWPLYFPECSICL